MRYVVTAEEMRRYDSNTIEQIGIPGMVLMERAALAARDRVLFYTRKSTRNSEENRILILTGVGNNGGDGLALARLLAEEGFQVEVWCVGDGAKASEQWKQQYKILKSYEVLWSDEPTALEYTILVDALFGVGLSREVEGAYQSAVERFNQIKGYKIALDIPSGICSDTGQVLGCGIRADETVTFAFAKRGLYFYPGCEYAGNVLIADIGIGERSFLKKYPHMFCLENETEWLPARSAYGNKGTFGKVLLIAGSAGMAGAAVLAARAAYRAGVGMVKVLTDEGNRDILQNSVPEAMYGTYDDLENGLSWADVVAIGPGLGRSAEAMRVLQRAVCDCEKPLLIDADGLNLLASDTMLKQELAQQRERAVVLTPHVGELARLTGLSVCELKENLWEYAEQLAQNLHAVVVAKDARTFVCAEQMPICVNVFGNNGMATAGSGDVLAGIIAGLMGQYCKMDSKPVLETVFQAACAGVRLHAAAGDAVVAKKGEYACMAGDIAMAVADVMLPAGSKMDREVQK